MGKKVTSDRHHGKQQVKAGKLCLPIRAPSLRAGLITAFGDILDHAQGQRLVVTDEPIEAVHRYRKSVRRARALVRLTREFMAADGYARISDALRTAHRATSQQRDRDVVLDTLDSLKFDPDARLHAESVRTAVSASSPTSVQGAGQLLDRGSELLDPLPQVFADALPKKVGWSDVAKGLQHTYRRARRDMHRTFHSNDDEAIHDWRKRTKELNYQVELLTSAIDDSDLRRTRKRLANMAEELGKMIDLMVLDDYVQIHAETDGEKSLTHEIVTAKEQLLRDALTHGNQVYEDKPKVFSREIIDATRKAHRAERFSSVES